MNIEAEQVVLGAILHTNSMLAVISPFVSREDFSEEVHRRTFDVASQMIAAGQSVSPITLKSYIGDAELAPGVTIGAYIARLAGETVPPSAATGYARLVRSLAARRRLITAASELDRRARDVAIDDEPAEIAAATMLELQTIAAASATDTSRPIGDVADDVIREVQGVRDGTITARVVTTGYADLDRAMNGLKPETLVIAAGRPGMGKTMVANSIGYRCARSGVGVLEWPLEVGAEQMVARHIADIAYRGFGRSPEFRDIGERGFFLQEDHVEAVYAARDRLRELPIVVDGRPRVTVAQIAAKVAQVRRDMRSRGVELGLVILDHLDFIAAGDRYRGNRVQEIGEIVLGLKNIARSQKLCVLLMSQLSRDVEKRGQKERRPTLADLRNSGDLEQVADVVMFLYRPEYYLTSSPEFIAGNTEVMAEAEEARGKLDVILAKVRSGPTPTIKLWCDPACSTVSSFERGHA